MKILAESSEDHFIAYCPEHDKFHLAWNRFTLHLDSDEFEQLQTMFEEILLDEILTLLESDEEMSWSGFGLEEADDLEEIVLWFEDVALRVTVDEFQEMAFLVSEAALAAEIRPHHLHLSVRQPQPRLELPTNEMSLFSLN